MSTEFKTIPSITMSDLFDGRLEQLGIREVIVPGETDERWRCLTDGQNYLWAVDNTGGTLSIKRYGMNSPWRILEAISVLFDTEVVSEYEPQFWGCDTEEEMSALLSGSPKEDDLPRA